jgi:AraC family transcriptional regulator, regulatory protein of adaptative response / DNA-3-methyladenine glycosylase II
MDARSNPLAHQSFYAAFAAHDARFDGRVFVGVTSTGIYCRPVCRVRTPVARNCRFFANAASAEHAGFRPCLRCRPELAPGLSLVDSSEVLAHHAARTIEQAAREGQALAMPQIAQRLGVTDRHLRRIFTQVHGVSPIDYLTTQRLLLAKQLLTDTAMPVTQVALASGFGSLRRFNAAFVQRYRLQPTGLRKQRDARTSPDDVPGDTPGDTPDDVLALRLAWRPPYDVAGVLRFFADRQLAGVEHVSGHTLRRTLALQHRGERHSGWLSACWRPERNELELRVAPSLTPAVGVLLQAARQAFDLDADPQRIDPVLAPLPGPPAAGMRVPNGFDGWETAVRVVLGQQVTVAAARTLVQRLVQRFGEAIVTPFAELNRLFPTAEAIARADPAAIGTLGIVRQRVRALQALAAEVHEGRITLNRAAPLQATLDALRALPGIGEWTAQLVAMRALAWPDAFPSSDIGVLNALRTRDPAEAERRAEAWRPWRAYAVIALWQTLIPPEPLSIKEAA